MKCIFGLELDGRSWPTVLGDQQAVAGVICVGPKGLLSLLETHLGLSRPEVSNALRAASLLPGLLGTKAFWSKSAEADPFATASELIRWDEQLWLHGWQGQGVSERLEQLAALMTHIPAGLGQRLFQVTEATREHGCQISELKLVGTAIDKLPQIFQSLLSAMEAGGCTLVEIGTPTVEGEGDLKDCLSANYSPAGTGELQLIRGQGPNECAEAVAVWLAEQPDLDQTVLVGGDSLLQSALHQHGVPVPAMSTSEHADPIAQVLPLVIHLAWAPQRPQDALQLLHLPESPVPRTVSWHLDRALRDWPAIGSKAWQTALQKGLESIEDVDRRKRLTARLAVLFGVATQGDECKTEALLERVDVLTGWMQGRLSLRESQAPRWASAIDQARLFKQMVEATGLASLSRPMCDAFLRTVMKQSRSTAGTIPEAGLAQVNDPGSIVGPVKRLVWWGFTDRSARTSHGLPLTPDERKTLAEHGIQMPSGVEMTELEYAGWRRPLEMTREAALLVCPSVGADGEPESPHPIWDEVTAGLDESAVSQLTHKVPIGLAKNRIVEVLTLPTAHATWILNDPSQLKLPERHSPTSLNALLANPLYWVLKYPAKLASYGRTNALPHDALILGNLSHDIIGRLLLQHKDGSLKDPADASVAAAKIYDTEGPLLYTELFVPGRERERDDIRKKICDAALYLFKHLEEAGATVQSVEADHEVTFEGIALKGRTDAEISGPDTVLDLKWGGRDKRYKELASGGTSQLAVYTRLTKPQAAVGYFIISDQTMLLNREGLPGARVVEGPTMDAVWNGLKQAFNERLQQLKVGTVLDLCAIDDGAEPPGKSALKNGMLYIAPEPEYSPYAWLSGLGGQS